MSTEHNLPDYCGCVVLLVEDNRVNQLVAKTILSKANFNISVANNGQEAVDMVQQQTYQLVLMDIQMPVMDGMQAVKAIRELGGNYLNIPIIAMTGQDFAGDRQKIFDVGMNEHITKPISPDILFQTIAQFIEPKAHIVEKTDSVDELQLPTHLTQINLPAAMHRFINNWTVLKRTMLSFAESHVDDVEKIKKALAENDMATATRLAHSLKGSGGNIGAEALSKIAAVIESLLKENDLNSIEEKLQSLEQTLSLVCIELSSLESVTESSNNEDLVKELTSESINNIQGDMKSVKENIMLDYGRCQTLVEKLTESLQGSQWAMSWKKVANAVNQFDFNLVGQLIDQLTDDIDKRESKA
jgi:CheY-like chemotaxis protein/HPt (histidine-containing phosphotransfer) domain-containing protein